MKNCFTIRLISIAAAGLRRGRGLVLNKKFLPAVAELHAVNNPYLQNSLKAIAFVNFARNTH